VQPILTDAEIDEICAGLTQAAAKVRYLRDVLRVPVERKPNGRPLVRRADWERLQPAAQYASLAGKGDNQAFMRVCGWSWEYSSPRRPSIGAGQRAGVPGLSPLPHLRRVRKVTPPAGP
jgi:hypothetical protein